MRSAIANSNYKLIKAICLIAVTDSGIFPVGRNRRPNEKHFTTYVINLMADEKNLAEASGHADSMVFGFDRATDETSLIVFLEKMTSPPLLATMASRLEDHEIEVVVDLFTGLMKKHLSKKEYHRLFLGDVN